MEPKGNRDFYKNEIFPNHADTDPDDGLAMSSGGYRLIGDVTTGAVGNWTAAKKVKTK